jgi:hypothetical protein
MRPNWQAAIESRADYDHPEYPVSRWKREVFEGKTRLGYAQLVFAMLQRTAPLPDALKQFKPRSNVGRSVQRAVVEEFVQTGATFAARQNGHGWFAMRHAFENLIPFIVARGTDAFIIARATEENRSDLAELKSEVIFEWDGYNMLDYESM